MGKKAPAPPPAPDPVATANAQAAANKQAVQYNAATNSVDQYSPMGSIVYSRRADGTPYAVTTNLNPASQAAYDGQMQMTNDLTRIGLDRLANTPRDGFTTEGMPWDPRSVNVNNMPTWSSVSMARGNDGGIPSGTRGPYSGPMSYQRPSDRVFGNGFGQTPDQPTPQQMGYAPFQQFSSSQPAQAAPAPVNNAAVPAVPSGAAQTPAPATSRPATPSRLAAPSNPLMDAAQRTQSGSTAKQASKQPPAATATARTPAPTPTTTPAPASNPAQSIPRPAAPYQGAATAPAQMPTTYPPAVPYRGDATNSGSYQGSTPGFGSTSNPAPQMAPDRGRAPPTVLPYDQNSYGNMNYFSNNVGRAMFDDGMSQLAPVFAQKDRALEQSLANRGLPMTGEAYRTAMSDNAREQNRAYTSLANQSTMGALNATQGIVGMEQSLRDSAFNQGLKSHQQNVSDFNTQIQTGQNLRSAAINENMATRNQNINEASAAIRGAPAINSPSQISTGQYNMQAPDVMGATYNSYNGAMQNYQAQQAQRSSMMSGVFGIASAALPFMMSSEKFKVVMADA